MLPIQNELRKKGNTEKALWALRFFKTWPGEYGEWDIFLGVTVPETRKIVQSFSTTTKLSDISILLSSEYHEERLAWLHMLVLFAKKKRYSIKELGEFYMEHVPGINNWDLVDTSAPDIIGAYIETLTHEERVVFIEKCITSSNLWIQRIIIVASFYQIKNGNDRLIFFLVPRFLTHPHDLMHKACGWMLREAGKRVSEERLCNFLDTYTHPMPRTMLRYAIERLSQDKRMHYMNLGK